MPATSPTSGACNCGQVVFDLSDRKNGEVLSCSWCGRKFRYSSDKRITPLTADEVRRAVAAPGQPLRVRSAPAKPAGPPGGMMPMIGCIIGFNGLVFFALWLLMPNDPDGSRHLIGFHDAFWAEPKALWPELSALVIGHLLGFACWAAYVYKMHQREKTENKP